jgi:glyoxylase-like metal-dependent hydrolase (beta-lactamase superfamily II)
MGSLKVIQDKYPGIEVICHKEQAPYIIGKAKSLRLIQAEDREALLTEAEKVNSKHFMDYLASIQTVDTVTAVVGGEPLPLYEDVVIIDTSGHMPGHISLYLTEEQTLIAGDSMVVENNELCIANPQYTFDMKRALESIENLLDYNIKKVICYHGGEITGDIRKYMEDMLRKARNTVTE